MKFLTAAFLILIYIRAGAQFDSDQPVHQVPRESSFLYPDSTRYNSRPGNDDDKVLNFWDKAYTGGDFAFFGGTGQLYFNISPLLGYRPQNKGFSLGIGATYQYTYLNDVFYGSYAYSLFGVRGFVRQQLGEHFFIHGEYENYFTKGVNIFTQKRENIIIPCANAFLGYKQHFSEFSYYYIMLGYEFIHDPYTRYVYGIHPLVFKVGYIFNIRGGN